MKQTVWKYLAVAALSAAPLAAQAEFVDGTAPQKNIAVQSVKDAKTMFDGSRVTLEGYITGRAGTLNYEEYFFKDDSDMIKVEIDDDVWRGQQVNPQTKVRLVGEVDHNRFNGTVEIEVDQLTVIQ
ncbi:MAG: NirD/YgiW/YdeI family stress tolerance protein [Neisseria sp.]|nr:NirD/YgiW/YdeI family stress tolerance protein [Neisseria sp.]